MDGVLLDFIGFLKISMLYIVNIIKTSLLLIISPIQHKISPEEFKQYNLPFGYMHKFSSTELSNFYELFTSICKEGNSYIGVEDIVKIDQMRVNPFAYRICMLFSEDGSGRLTFYKFLNVISTFSRHTSSEIKTIWIFSLWDFDGDDVINAEDIMHGIGLLTSSGLLSNPYIKLMQRCPSSEGLDEHELFDIADKVSYETDPKRDGISFMDFRGLLMRMPDLVSNFDIFIL